MKKNVLTLLFCVGAMLAFQTESSAQTLIHYWHFNNYSQGAMYTPTINGIPADFSIHDTSKAKILYAELSGTPGTYSSYIDSLQPLAADNDIYNARMGQPSGGAIRARNRSDSMQLLFYIPVTNYYNIVLKFNAETTNNGAQTENYDYSVDSGATYTTTGLSSTTFTFDSTHVFKPITINFPSTVLNTNKLVFRIKFSNGSTDTSGNNRFDNVTVEGDSIIASTSVAMNGSISPAAFTLFPNPVTNSLKIMSMLEGDKSVSITNEMGQSVYTGKESGKSFTVNTSGFAAGNYFISIKDSNSGKVNTMKFVKQ